jgi:hypothetical protein
MPRKVNGPEGHDIGSRVADVENARVGKMLPANRPPVTTAFRVL